MSLPVVGRQSGRHHLELLKRNLKLRAKWQNKLPRTKMVVRHYLRPVRLFNSLTESEIVKYCSLTPLNLCTVDFTPSYFYPKLHFKMADVHSDAISEKVFKLNVHISFQ